MPFEVAFQNFSSWPQSVIIPNATPKNDGVMTAAQAKKLDSLTPSTGLVIENGGVALPTEPALNFEAPLVATDNPGSSRIDVSAVVPPTMLYGPGSDGDFVAPPGTTTLDRKMYYRTFLVPVGATVRTNSNHIFASVSAINDGIIDANGGDGQAGAAGGAAGVSGGNNVGSPASSLGAGTAGGVGGQGQAAGGSDGGSSTSADATMGGLSQANGGVGGDGSAGGGGNGGNVAVAAHFEPAYEPYFSRVVATGTQYSNVGGGGGGGGAGDNVNPGGTGGGGGGSGGSIYIASPLVTNNGTIRANGGKGGNGQSVAGFGIPDCGAGGGGGGGNGGHIEIVSNGPIAGAGTMTAAGGAPGTGGTADGTGAGTDGAPGVAGSAGHVVTITITTGAITTSITP